jgi:hypothetical protein
MRVEEFHHLFGSVFGPKFSGAMTGTGQSDQSGFDTRSSERLLQQFALVMRHLGVPIAMEDEKRASSIVRAVGCMPC